MAIRIECYGLITQSRIGKLYFPKQYADEWNRNDGTICNPMSAMNRRDMATIVEDCMKLGLKRYKEENGERTIGDFYVATQSGLDDTLDMKSDWLRVYQCVAWNPACPMGIGCLTSSRVGMAAFIMNPQKNGKLPNSPFPLTTKCWKSIFLNVRTPKQALIRSACPHSQMQPLMIISLPGWGRNHGVMNAAYLIRNSRHSAFPETSGNGQAHICPVSLSPEVSMPLYPLHQE